MGESTNQNTQISAHSSLVGWNWLLLQHLSEPDSRLEDEGSKFFRNVHTDLSCMTLKPPRDHYVKPFLRVKGKQAGDVCICSLWHCYSHGYRWGDGRWRINVSGGLLGPAAQSKRSCNWVNQRVRRRGRQRQTERNSNSLIIISQIFWISLTIKGNSNIRNSVLSLVSIRVLENVADILQLLHNHQYFPTKTSVRYVPAWNRTLVSVWNIPAPTYCVRCYKAHTGWNSAQLLSHLHFQSSVKSEAASYTARYCTFVQNVSKVRNFQFLFSQTCAPQSM